MTRGPASAKAAIPTLKKLYTPRINPVLVQPNDSISKPIRTNQPGYDSHGRVLFSPLESQNQPISPPDFSPLLPSVVNMYNPKNIQNEDLAFSLISLGRRHVKKRSPKNRLPPAPNEAISAPGLLYAYNQEQFNQQYRNNLSLSDLKLLGNAAYNSSSTSLPFTPRELSILDRRFFNSSSAARGTPSIEEENEDAATAIPGRRSGSIFTAEQKAFIQGEGGPGGEESEHAMNELVLFDELEGTIAGGESHDESLFPIGSIVEVRKSLGVIFGIVLDVVVSASTLRLRILSLNGHVWYPYSTSCSFIIPSYIPEDLAGQVGPGDLPVDAHEARARGHCITHLRRLEKMVERVAGDGLSLRLDAAYGAFMKKAEDEGITGEVWINTNNVWEWSEIERTKQEKQAKAEAKALCLEEEAAEDGDEEKSLTLDLERERFGFLPDELRDVMETPFYTQQDMTLSNLENSTHQKGALMAGDAAGLPADFDSEPLTKVALVNRYAQVGEYAVHKYMMERPTWFIASRRNMSGLRQWRLRPRKEVDILEAVNEWVITQDHRSHHIDAFVEKAKILIQHSREVRKGSDSTSPLIPAKPTPTPPIGITFSEEDRTIISYIQSALKDRSLQPSPYASVLPSIIKRVGLHGDVIDRSAVSSFLKEIGVLKPWENVAPLGSELSLDVSREEEATMDRLAEKALAMEAGDEAFAVDELEEIRHDFGDLPVYVIDDPTAQELDDGVSIEPPQVNTLPSGEEHRSVWVHTHIADPTTYLRHNHTISAIAENRASTLYLPEATLPLLPKQLTTDRFSLDGKTGPGGRQQTLSFSAKIDIDSGLLIESRIRAGYVRNIQKVTYDDVNALLGATPRSSHHPFQSSFAGSPVIDDTRQTIPKHHAGPLSGLRSVVQLLSQLRYQNGGFSWNSPSATLDIDGQQSDPVANAEVFRPIPVSQQPMFFSGFPRINYSVPIPEDKDIDSSPPTPAQHIVSELMILAGRIAGNFCSTHGIPMLYRSMEPPVAPTSAAVSNVMEMRDPVSGQVPSWAATSNGIWLRPSTISLSPSDQWMMGVMAEEGGYVRVTSPLRRYSDLVAHWQIKKALLLLSSKEKTLDVTELPFNNTRLQEISAKLTRVERSTNEVSNASKVWWQTVLLSRMQMEKSPPKGTLPSLITSKPKSEQSYLTRVLRASRSTNLRNEATFDGLISELGVMLRVKHDPREPWQIGGETWVSITSCDTGPNPSVEGEVTIGNP